MEARLSDETMEALWKETEEAIGEAKETEAVPGENMMDEFSRE